MKLYYKYIIRPQILLKYPYNSFNNYNIKELILNIYINTTSKHYFLYLYNICLLIRMLTNKIITIKSIKRSYSLDKLHLQLRLKNSSLFTFMETWTQLLLPNFENFNMSLKFSKFDSNNKFCFLFKYIDPIFTCKNIVTIWGNNVKVNLSILFKNANKKQTNVMVLQLLQFKWYL